ncbi:unnamed protein product [Ilex paraguariensis]|uniref:Uncharacterized protein n=1 Tax=Ilex paraguariensis TaxID=185542 RepID=A0ABC8R4T6_9AQUA
MEAQLAKDVRPFNFMTPMRMIRDAILGLGSPASILVSEGANTINVGRAVLIQTKPRSRLDAGTWGTMGMVWDIALLRQWIHLVGLWFLLKGSLDLGFVPWKLRFVPLPNIIVHLVLIDNPTLVDFALSVQL